MYVVDIRVELDGVLRPEELTSIEQIEMATENAVALSLQAHFDFVKIDMVNASLASLDEVSHNDGYLMQ